MKDKLVIYLADLVHNFIPSRDIWTIPLNICDIAAYVKTSFGDRVEIRLFKFPDQLLVALQKQKPDIIALSNYIWNFELSKGILKAVKGRHPDVLTVMGGPNITQEPLRMRAFFLETGIDYYISLYGEHPFKCLVEAMLDEKLAARDVQKSRRIHGVWYLDPDTRQAVSRPVRHAIDDLDEIPSPFTMGLVDEFLTQDLMPMIETSRGCPFCCTYCDWGSAGLRRLTKYSVERVKQDIDYCRAHSKDDRLMIVDANFGILGNRDLEIADYLSCLNRDTGYPKKLIVTWPQAKSDVTLQVADKLREMLMITTSFQSMDEQVLKNIKRRNISHEDFRAIIDFCVEKGIDTYGELMVALPGETLRSHFDALRYLFDNGVDFINMNPLMLLEGAELADRPERERYKFRTKWRLLENCYGIYQDEPVLESQEMVIETSTMSQEDVLCCRQVSWLIQMSWNLKRHDLLIRFLKTLGINPLDFFLRVIKDHKSAPREVASVFDDFAKDAREEMFDTREGLVAFYSREEQMEKLKRGGFRKLNTHYTSRVSLECDRELTGYYADVATAMVLEKGLLEKENEMMINDCAAFMYQRYLGFKDLTRIMAGEDAGKKLSFRYDILGWARRGCAVLKDFYRPAGISYEFTISPEQKDVLREHLKRFDGLSVEYQLRKLQEPYHGIHKKYLLYNVQESANN